MVVWTLLPIAAFLAALSSYGLYLSYHNITRLQKYEEQSEKAAKWSNTAAQRLHKTRTTQTSGTVTLLVSLITSLVLLFSLSNRRIVSFAAILNLVALYAARTHMGQFWNDRNQVQVPFVEKFNEAIKGSELVVKVLDLLLFGWFHGAYLLLLGSDSWLGLLAYAVSNAGWAAFKFGYISPGRGD